MFDDAPLRHDAFQSKLAFMMECGAGFLIRRSLLQHKLRGLIEVL